MVGHPDIHQASHACHSPPFRYTTSDRHIYIQDVDCIRGNQVAATIAGDLALTCADRDSAGRSNLGKSAELIVPANRFLNPPQTETLDTAAEFDRLIHGPRLIRI